MYALLFAVHAQRYVLFCALILTTCISDSNKPMSYKFISMGGSGTQVRWSSVPAYI